MDSSLKRLLFKAYLGNGLEVFASIWAKFLFLFYAPKTKFWHCIPLNTTFVVLLFVWELLIRLICFLFGVFRSFGSISCLNRSLYNCFDGVVLVLTYYGWVSAVCRIFVIRLPQHFIFMSYFIIAAIDNGYRLIYLNFNVVLIVC